jgi:tripartite-type tricarboxylate transporter receptor subunit TctC
MRTTKTIALATALAGLCAAPASAQFYKDKTLTLLINYGVGGNADTEARVYQRFLPKYIPGNPSIVIQNAPGAGGINGINVLGMGLGAKPDGYTMGYFTVSATDSLVDNPALKVKIPDFAYVAGARGWNIAYGRKDIPPGMTKPSDLGKATKLFLGGYSKASSVDTRLRLAADIMGIPYQLVTGFPGTADINKAMIQGEVNFTVSSLPGFTTQAVPQIIEPGIGMAYFQYSIIGADGKPAGNENLRKQGIQIFEDFYQQAFGKAPSGPKAEALLILNDIGSKLQRAMVFNTAAPAEAVQTMRKAVAQVAADPEFQSEFKRVTSENADLVAPAELDPLFARVRSLDPTVKKVLAVAVNGE